MKKTSKDIYAIYERQYKANVQKVRNYDNPVTADKLSDDMMTREMFEATMGEYRIRWNMAHPGRHGESAERIAKWAANIETQDRSYKQAKNIKKVANELGYDITMNDIRWGSQKVSDFWSDYAVLVGNGEINVSQLWGS